jgi:RimJ/RimL family protein N-acetyltransferase
MDPILPIATERLLLRPPRPDDAQAIFDRYSSSPEVTRWLSWPRHRDLDETLRFIAWSDQQWIQWPAGPLLILERLADGAEGRLLGATGLAFTAPARASTGYLLAPDAWGQGLATEALGAMVSLAPALGVRYLAAFCQAHHVASAHVLEKCNFTRCALLRRHTEFPNAVPGERLDVLQFERVF